LIQISCQPAAFKLFGERKPLLGVLHGRLIPGREENWDKTKLRGTLKKRISALESLSGHIV
jgi:hypothetical protein